MYNKEAKARYRAKNLEKCRMADREYSRKYRASNRAKVIESKRNWHLANRGRVLPKMRAYYEENKERLLAASRRYNRIWKRKNRHKVAEYSHSRRVRKYGNGHKNCSDKIRLLSLERFCHWCCDKLSRMNLTIDHVIPLSRGGEHIPDNLVSCCRSCNLSKGNKLVHEWTWRTI